MRDKTINTSNDKEGAPAGSKYSADSFRFKALRTDYAQNPKHHNKSSQSINVLPSAEAKPTLESGSESEKHIEIHTAIEAESDDQRAESTSQTKETEAAPGHAPNPDSEKAPEKTRRTSIWIYSTVFITACISAYAVFQYGAPLSNHGDIPIRESNNSNEIVARPPPSSSALNRQMDIGTIVSNLSRESVWDVQKLHILKTNWLRLDREKQAAIYNSDWFIQFKAALNQQVNTSLNKNIKNQAAAIARHAALVDLEELLNKSAALNKSADNTPTAPAKQKPKSETPNNIANSTFASMAPAIKAADLAAQSAPQTADTSSTASNNPTANNAAASDTTSQQQAVKADTDKNREGGNAKQQDQKLSLTTPNDTNEAQKTSDTRPTRIPVETNNKDKKFNYVNGVFTGIAKNRDPDKPTFSELNDLVVQLTYAYDSGDLERFTSLFALESDNENRTQLNQTIEHFTNMMRGTSDRQMFIKDMQWSFKKRRAVGTGVLTVMLISDEEQIDTFFKKIELTVVKEKRKARIAKFEQLEF